MYVQTKKVVIIFIVTIITFVSIINVLYEDVKDTIPQISVISSEELSYKVSYAQNIFNEFSIEGDENDELAMYGASIYQISQQSNAQLSNIVKGSDMTIIVGDTFNDYLDQLIAANESKQFVLIENSNIYDYDNVYQVNINYNSIYNSINQLSKNQKSVVIISNQFSSLAENKYYENQIATNGNIKLEIIKDTTNVVALKDALDNDFAEGFTNVYSLNPYNSSSIIETIKNYNDNLADENETEKKIKTNSEQSISEVNSEQSISEVSSEESTEVSESPRATLRYLSLNKSDFISSSTEEGIFKYDYDASANMKEVIRATLNGKLLSKKELISITNNE